MTTRTKLRCCILKILYRLNLRVNFLFPRPFQRYGLNGKGKDLVGVETGVFEGENALSILKNSSIKKLYLVDPYLHYEDWTEYSSKNLDKAEETAHNRLLNFNNKIVWIKKKSADAINDIPNDLDFIYLDANHAYTFVKQEINSFYPKLKKGGVLAGHNFHKTSNSNYGVVKAVIEFAVKNELELYVWGYDWWLIKQ